MVNEQIVIIIDEQVRLVAVPASVEIAHQIVKSVDRRHVIITNPGVNQLIPKIVYPSWYLY